MKAVHTPEDFDKNFLGEIGGIGAIEDGARQQRIDRLMVARNQPGECFL